MTEVLNCPVASKPNAAGAAPAAGPPEASLPPVRPDGAPRSVPSVLLLVGNPNVGKSIFFGNLTGRYVNVSNYPGTTVEVARGRPTRAVAAETAIREVLDSPGVNTLIPLSEDERVTRDLLLDDPSAMAVQVADAKNLRRALLLTLELAERRQKETVPKC